MPMRKKCGWKGAEQRTLFEPPRSRPRWFQLPVEVREEAVRLLAQALRDHFARALNKPMKGGGKDE
jgi:hypothetical protein